MSRIDHSALKIILVLSLLSIFALHWRQLVSIGQVISLIGISMPLISEWSARRVLIYPAIILFSLVVIKKSKIRLPLLFIVIFTLFIFINIFTIGISESISRSYSRGINSLLITLLISVIFINIFDTQKNVHLAFVSYIFGGYILFIGMIISILADPSAGAQYSAFNLTPSDLTSNPGNHLTRNRTGVMIVFGIPLSWYLLKNKTSKKILAFYPLIYIIYILLGSVFVILTSSRQSFVLLLVCYFYIFATVLSDNESPIQIFHIIGLCLSTLLFSLVFFRDSMERILTIYPLIVNLEGNVGSRVDVFVETISIATGRPILGHGAATYDVVIGEGSRNTWVILFFELGIVGILCFSIFFLLFFYYSLRISNKMESYMWITLFVMFGALSLIRDIAYHTSFYIFFSILVSSYLNNKELRN